MGMRQVVDRDQLARGRDQVKLPAERYVTSSRVVRKSHLLPSVKNDWLLILTWLYSLPCSRSLRPFQTRATTLWGYNQWSATSADCIISFIFECSNKSNRNFYAVPKTYKFDKIRALRTSLFISSLFLIRLTVVFGKLTN